MNKRQRKKWRKKHPDIFSLAFARMEEKITIAWNRFWSQLPPDIKDKIESPEQLLNSSLMEAAEQWAEEELKRQIRGTSLLKNPVGIMGWGKEDLHAHQDAVGH
jgi:uncharacterized protein HemY